VCHLILGRSFEHSITVLQCLSPLPLLFGLASVFGMQTMLVFEMDALFSKIMLLSAVVALPVTIILSMSFGAVGAAVASVTTSGFMVAAMLFALHAKGLHVWQHPKPQSPAFADASCAGVK
jgi:PST family polysaccharide transporter